MPTKNQKDVVLTNHWLIRTSGYPILEGYYWTKSSGFTQKTETLNYKSPFLSKTFTIPSGNRVIQPITLSCEMYYGDLENIIKGWNQYRNQPITIIQQANICSPDSDGNIVRSGVRPRVIVPGFEKTIKYTGCIWVAISCGSADRAQQSPNMVELTFSYVRTDDGTTVQ